MRYAMLAGMLALSGCANEVVYRGAPPAGYTHPEYACKLKGDCDKTRMPKAWDSPNTQPGQGTF
jgi:hypothetical protein